MVVTGIDRPIPDPNPCPRFFVAAALPVTYLPCDQSFTFHHCWSGHSPKRWEVSRFRLRPIEMDHHPDVDAGLLHNAEKVLAVADGFIRQARQQWSVPLPVWPQVMDLVPK